ncbi:YqcI/YcgG family protein [Streptomyces sp. NPDC088097]|uniref:YqcI/YcgG family protein n=1 Tax=Streptomyces sp. NPDC088097 TaxID=3365823 RepID=UPI003818F76C
MSSSTTYGSLFRADEHPEGLESHFAGFAQSAGSKEFPCVFAPLALRKGELLFGVGNVAHEGWKAAVTLMNLAAEAIWDDPDQVVVLWLDGIDSDSLEGDHEAFRQILLTLLEAGGWWPADAPVDPADPKWNFWYQGIDFFINVSTHHHRLRRSRNLGHPFTLVVQSRASFDRLPVHASAARRQIRRRLAAYDAVDVSPHLGTHGDAPELPQYFLGDTNGCPYTALAGRDVTGRVTPEEETSDRPGGAPVHGTRGTA